MSLDREELIGQLKTYLKTLGDASELTEQQYIELLKAIENDAKTIFETHEIQVDSHEVELLNQILIKISESEKRLRNELEEVKNSLYLLKRSRSASDAYSSNKK
tara:strand:+ start:7160 stop:7471 length:312 start_codon:yes stop_codon:yes gene_type:complete